MAEEKIDKIFFELAPLPSSDWLEKGILGHDGKSIIVSKETLSFHYGKHHAGYVKKLNAALNIAEESGNSFPTDLEELITKTSNNVEYEKIFNCAAQHWNHAFYWNCMVNIPDANWKIGDTEKEPTVIAAIKKDLGDDFLQTFSAAAAGLFGSGWAWLVYNQGKIEIVKTSNAMNPLVDGKVPLLVCDVWEHAYYVDHRNNRGEYIKRFISAINWTFVEKNYKAASSNLSKPLDVGGSQFFEVQPTKEMQGVVKKEMKRVREVLGSDIIRMEHIGSSSIPGMPGTAVVDCILGMKNYPPTEEQKKKMIKLGYKDGGKAPHAPDDYWFHGGADVPRGHLGRCVMHFEKNDNPQISNFIAFREYCIANESAFKRYAEIKMVLAKKADSGTIDGHEDQHRGYKIKKGEVCDQIMKEAIEWNKNRN